MDVITYFGSPLTLKQTDDRPFLYFFFRDYIKNMNTEPSLFIVGENRLSLKMSLEFVCNDPILKLHFIISIIMKAASNMQKCDSLWTMCKIRVQVKRTKGQKTSAVTKTKSVDRFDDTKEIAILKI